MNAAVFATRWGRRFHQNPGCKKLEIAQLLSDWDCGYDYCTHRHPQTHSAQEFSLAEALESGRWPCRSCWPTGLELGANSEDFGHRPVDEYYDVPNVSRIVCARCTTWTRWSDVKVWAGFRVAWPCTSARVLGLVTRKESA